MMKLEDLLTFYNWTTTHIDMNKCQQLMEEGFLQMKKHVEYPLCSKSTRRYDSLRFVTNRNESLRRRNKS